MRVRNRVLSVFLSIAFLFVLGWQSDAFFVAAKPPNRGPTHASRAHVAVLSSSSYISKDGRWLNIVGELKNLDRRPVGWARIQVRYFDAEGRLVGTGTGYPLQRPIFPGERAPFHLLNEASSTIVTYTVQALAYPSRGDPVPALHLLSHSWFTTETGIPVLVGELENPLDVPVYRIRLPVTLYDQQGRVVNVLQAQVLRDVIPPHGRTPFVVRVEEGPVGARQWRWTAQYRPAPPSASAHGLFLGPISPAIDNSGYLVLRGTVKNGGPRRVNFVRLVGALYARDGTILNASFSYPLTYHLDPGETDVFEVEFRTIPKQWHTYRVVVGDRP